MDYYTLAKQIDTSPVTVSDWEAEFLDSILRRGAGADLSPKQAAKLRELGERYLSDQVMAEFHGQMRIL